MSFDWSDFLKIAEALYNNPLDPDLKKLHTELRQVAHIMLLINRRWFSVEVNPTNLRETVQSTLASSNTSRRTLVARVHVEKST